MSTIEEAVRDWRVRLSREGGVYEEDAEELESHLWDLIDSRMYAGSRPEEAFRGAVERMGEPRAIAAEFAVIYEEEFMDYEMQIAEYREDPDALERLYHQKPQAFTTGLGRALENHPDAPVLRAWKARLAYAPFLADRRGELVELLTVVGLCLVAAIASKLPLLWGVDVWDIDLGARSFYARNITVFCFPLIAAYYLIRQRPTARITLAVAAALAAAIVAVNLMPARDPWQTRVLSIVHLPFLLWLVVGLAFSGKEWRSLPVRIDFLRYSGELFIYTVLILLGGLVLTGFTLAIFNLIGMDIRLFYVSWIGLIGLLASPIVATWLTEKKRGLADNFAPVLSYIFTPLFMVTLVVFLAVTAALGKSPWSDREFLLMFNGMLVLVIALVLFNITERKLTQAARLFDVLNAVLIVAALAVDAMALSGVIVRLSQYGVSPNKIAVLGENLLLLVNLLGLAWAYARFFARRAPFSAVENWTARYLPAYLGWLAVVVFLFPVIFGYA